MASQLKICVVGGSDSWQKKISETFPFMKIIGNKDFHINKLDNVDVLIINTNYVSHAWTQKAYDLAHSQNAEIIYTAKNNLEQIKNEIMKRIKPLFL
ncbi:hypothetical protein ACTQX2_00080 [Megamonas funiformis]|uniref:hypothetical protein n=1 Tax=Megamonas funiformis TaxID=437897 RepID=UPI003F944841